MLKEWLMQKCTGQRNIGCFREHSWIGCSCQQGVMEYNLDERRLSCQVCSDHVDYLLMEEISLL
jgi:hypothetical protein